MRLRTVAVLLALLVALGGLAAVAFVQTGGGGATLTELWVSDTPRNNSVNHHGIGANEGVIVAPVTAQPGAPDLTRRSCSLVRLAPDDGAVRWWWGVAPSQCFSHALTKPAVTDLDGDTRQEIVVGTTENETVVLAANGTEQWAIPMATYSYARPTVADLAWDSSPELVASDISGDLVVATSAGRVRWRGNVSGSVWDSPQVVDVDDDGAREMVVGSSDETVAYEADGTVLWRRPVSASSIGVTRVDGRAMVVAVGFDGVVALDGATGAREWNRSSTGSPSMVSLADGDGDGTPEAYVSVANNVVRAIEADDGSEDWQTRLAPAEQTVTPPPRLADLDGDGQPSLVAPTSSGTVAILDPATGAERAAYEREVPIWTAVTAADITDSPGAEILVRYGDGRVVALSYG